MSAAMRETTARNSQAGDWGLVFEYELPLEGGRRPDVVLLAGGAVIVLEFKTGLEFAQAHLDQVEAYARDLMEYHESSRGRQVIPVLVMRDVPATHGRRGGTGITDFDGIASFVEKHEAHGEIDLHDWLTSRYVPLPTLVAAARRIFRHEHLPHIWRAEAAGIPQTVDLIHQLSNDVRTTRGRSVVFVTGVPGSGKTLVGLRAVYEHADTEGAATFLSGNGPLVEVLKDALQSKVFVRDLHAFIKTHGLQERVPSQHVIVFDEAQRAWDRGYMLEKKGVERSEPDLLVQAGNAVEDWCLLVGLVGEGQEIYSGEEGGMEQWRTALLESGQEWTVHCPPRLTTEFKGLRVVPHQELDLTVSLRSQRADELHRWVSLLLQGSVSLAARQATRIQDEATYPMYVTRDLDDAKAYLDARYDDDRDATYGLLKSSHAKNLDVYGLATLFRDRFKLNVARWFNAPAGDPQSGRSFALPVTEFQCQGLELDTPLVCWGSDMRWEADGWRLTPKRRKYRLRDPDQLLENAYRVLLTRGRDGLVVFVPPEPEMDATEHMLLAAGVRPLPDAQTVSPGLPIAGGSTALA